MLFVLGKPPAANQFLDRLLACSDRLLLSRVPLWLICGSFGPVHAFPTDSRSRAIPMEANASLQTLVQPLDGVAQSHLGIHTGPRGKGIIDLLLPVLLLKRG